MDILNFNDFLLSESSYPDGLTKAINKCKKAGFDTEVSETENAYFVRITGDENATKTGRFIMQKHEDKPRTFELNYVNGEFTDYPNTLTSLLKSLSR